MRFRLRQLHSGMAFHVRYDATAVHHVPASASIRTTLHSPEYTSAHRVITTCITGYYAITGDYFRH